MANIKSQIKRNRQTLKARARNRAARTELRTKIKSFLDAASSGDAEQARTALGEAHRALDQAAAKGTIHPNKAANQKSRLAKKLS